MFDVMGMVTGLMSQKVDASAVQNVVTDVQSQLTQNPEMAQKPALGADMLSGMVAQRLGLDAGMVQAVMPQIIQLVQNGALQNLLDSNRDGQIDLADIMGLINRTPAANA